MRNEAKVKESNYSDIPSLDAHETKGLGWSRAYVSQRSIEIPYFKQQ